MSARPRATIAMEIAFVALAVVAFYWIHLDVSRAAPGGDFLNLFWPMKELRLRALLDAGAVLLWNPYSFMGAPAAASMQHAVFYPIDYLFFWRSPVWSGLGLSVLFHNVLGGIGAWWWMRRGWQADAPAAVVCGLIFPCTGWFWGAQEHLNQVAAVAWMPWVLGSVPEFARGGATGRFIARYSGFSALQLLAGHPQAAFYTHVVAALMLAGLCIAHRGAMVRRLVPAWLAAGLLVGLLAAVQLLPAFELGAQSYRQFDKATPDYALGFSMPPDVLLTLFRPNMFGDYIAGFDDSRNYGEYAAHVGWATMLLAAIGLTSLLKKRRRLAFFLLILLALSYTAAMGGNFSLARFASGEFTEFPHAAQSIGELSPLELLVRLVPPAAGFRVPARVLAVSALVWATLAGCGAGWIATRSGGKNWIGVVLGIVSLLALYFPSTTWKFRHPQPMDEFAAAFDSDRARYSEPTLDTRIYRLTTLDADLLAGERDAESRAQWEMQLGAPPHLARWIRLSENMNAAVLLPSVEGYEEGLLPTVRTKDFLFKFNRHFRSFEPDAQLLALMGVSRLYADLPINIEVFPPDETESIPPLRPIYRVPGARGAAFWLEQAHGINLSALDGPWQLGAEPLGRRQDVIYDYGQARRWNEEWPRLATDVTNPNHVVISVEGNTIPPGDAVVAMAYSPGWIINDEDVQWLSAIHARVPQAAFNNGRAALEYRPQSYRLGLYLSAIGLIVWFVLVSRRKHAI